MIYLERIYILLCILCHKLFYLNIYFNKSIKLYGVPQYIYAQNIHFGEKNKINEGVFLHARNHIYLGDKVTLSHRASLITESYDISTFENYTEKKHSGKAIHIGDNVWICANVIILPGVKIANNIIVGAGSVVTTDLNDEGYIYAGNPVKKIRRIGV